MRSLQAYKNAMKTEHDILATLKEAGEMRCDLRASSQADEVAKTVPVVVILDASDGKKYRALAHRAHGVVVMLRDV